MRALKSEKVRGSMDNNKSTFTVELLQISDGFEITYSDTKGWGIGHKTFEKCDNMTEAINSYSNLVQLIQI